MRQGYLLNVSRCQCVLIPAFCCYTHNLEQQLKKYAKNKKVISKEIKKGNDSYGTLGRKCC